MAHSNVILLPVVTTPPPPAKSLTEVQKLISRIGKKLRQRGFRRKTLEVKMERCKEQLARLGDQLSKTREDEELRELATRVSIYCQEHQQELEQRAQGRTISFDQGGKFGWKDNPYKLTVVDEAALLKSIRRAGLVKKLVTWKPVIDLDAIRKDPALRAQLAGFTYSRTTTFRIEPAETDERLETEAGAKEPVWEIKKPRSRVVT